jgi:glycosyltransferase involved in cell wall biosynthesis
VEERVIFLGYVSAEDLPALYMSADIFVMPSSAELQSIATLEAMSCGKPVLAANARALPELVEHEVNGYLFESDNSNDAAYWMNKFLESAELWSAMGKVGITRSQSHSLKNTVRDYEDYYQITVEKHTVTQKRSIFKGLKIFDIFRPKKTIKS